MASHKDCGDCNQFNKLHTKVGMLIWGLGIAIPVILATLGFGATQLYNISEQLGSLQSLSTSVDRLESRFNAHTDTRSTKKIPIEQIGEYIATCNYGG